ncbi:MAG: hypothetical protein ACKO3G_05285 [Planctomycetaceae bacterium]
MTGTTADTDPAATPRAPPAAPPPFGTLPPFPPPLRHPLRALAWIVTVGVGLASLLLLLAILAALPPLNILALGVMLEAEARVARSGRLRDGVPFAGALPRLGTIVVGTWAWLLVVRVVTQAAADALLVDPAGPSARFWAVARPVAATLVGVHLVAALFDGGSAAAFVRPLRGVRRLVAALRDGSAWGRAAAALEAVATAIAPGRLAWLGARGFVGALAWLVLPTILFSALRDTTKPGGALVTLVGAALLAVVLSWAPFLQARFAAEGRFAAFREVAAVREMWRRAPVVMLLAIVVLYGLSLPLYLFKIFAAPRDVVLFLTPIFVVTIYPARLAVGWATHFAATRPRRRPLLVRIPVALLFLAGMAAYLFLLFFTPAIDAFGRRTLFDHHALLLPTPF